MPDTGRTFGIQTLQTCTWPELRQQWTSIESWGFDSLWLPDHFVPTARPEGPFLEAWTLLSALAMATERVRLGVLVSSNTFRHPSMLAKQAVTVDHISNGRLELGIGAGWFVWEHERFGLDFPPTKELVDRYEEAVTLLDTYLRNDVSSFNGQHYTLDEAPNRPAPIQRPRPPLVLGAHGRRTIGIAGRYADTWNSRGTPAEIRERNARLDDAASAAGRDPASIKRSLLYVVAQMPEEQPWDSVEAFRDFIGRFSDAGMADFILQPPPPERFDIVERVAHEVIPELR
jgi:F420-dependent oxidoreductase-like protein